MADVDRYEAWYTHKLWTLLPEVYRAEDAVEPDGTGPLEELVGRIGVQMAVVRRSIDRLWEDQMIETCDDWVIDYIGDLLATNLVASLDARGRRVDVGRTIYYRRRKGTVALLEELAGDITGWTVRVAEFFRRLGRNRHLLDVPIGRHSAGDPRTDLQRAQGLVGALTRTPAGGLADLRNVHGAQLAGSAFDEFFHTGDVRRGRGATGWHDIPRLGVFLWRLHSLGVEGASALQDTRCPNQYTIDPTGRDLQLFAPAVPVLADVWVSPREDQVPGPISTDLLVAAFDTMYAPNWLFVRRLVGGLGPDDYVPVPAAEVSRDRHTPTGRFFIDPERGRLVAPVGDDDGPYLVDYHYGFASEIGAGPYERRRPGSAGDDAPEPRVAPITGGAGLAAALRGLGPTGTITIGDSRTYGDVADVSGIEAVEIRAANDAQPYVRPLVRPDAPTWVFTGDPGAVLTFDGLFLAGTELVLRGDFERVTLRCSTLDPGSWDEDDADFAEAADGRALSPASLRIEGAVGELVVDRCILGPIAESAGGALERLTALDSVVHACKPGAKSITLTSGTTSLVRITLIGPARLHRLDASECLLASDVQVDDTQHGCLRFCGWIQGSTVPRQYECVSLPVGTAVLASTTFGAPDYARVLDTVGPPILEGGPDGSELGAFARERSAVKERSLLIKYREYLPLGLEPVLVHVT